MQSTVHITVQTGLAVGDTQEEKEKAEFTKLQVWVSIHMTSKIKSKCLCGLRAVALQLSPA